MGPGSVTENIQLDVNIQLKDVEIQALQARIAELYKVVSALQERLCLFHQHRGSSSTQCDHHILSHVYDLKEFEIQRLNQMVERIERSVARLTGKMVGAQKEVRWPSRPRYHPYARSQSDSDELSVGRESRVERCTESETDSRSSNVPSLSNKFTKEKVSEDVSR